MIKHPDIKKLRRKKVFIELTVPGQNPSFSGTSRQELKSITSVKSREKING